VILVLFVYFVSFPSSMRFGPSVIFSLNVSKLFKLAILYAGFAFIISLIREVIKDMEDMEGDEKYGCKTMPIVWGIPATKVFTAVWIIVLVSALVILQFYALHLRWWWSVAYCVVTIIIPLLWILRKLYQAQVPKDYHRLSTAVKLVMLAGILSMIFFKVYS
jgi:4-hydroxybenzoate polyprenyltransferase